MKTHKMRLVTKAFDNIKRGIKKIEIRLNDEKRQLINIDDEIIFEEVSKSPRFMKVKVLNLIYASSFKELIESNEDISIFYDKDISKEELISLYYTFYTKEEENKYGVLGIEVKVIEGKLEI